MAKKFQSTHPRRVRQKLLLHLYHGLPISIHAPAKGATRITSKSNAGTGYFNPRTREGCDNHTNSPNPKSNRFQSTHPRRVRLGRLLIAREPRYFNPRTREGCDDSRTVSSASSVISIHAPAKGATVTYNTFAELRAYFNPRTREGCDLFLRLGQP